jgi:SOS response regulatory protein OraA/RecX
VESAFDDGLRMLARRELSSSQLRARLLERDHPSADVEAAIAQLKESGALDDARVARAYAETALKVKGRGRLRIQRELNEMARSTSAASSPKRSRRSCAENQRSIRLQNTRVCTSS